MDYAGLAAKNKAASSPYGTLANSVLSGAQGAGYFDPNGSAILKAQRKRQALQAAMNARRRGSVSARLFGLDPSAARAQAGLGERQSAGDVANYLNDSQFQEQQGNQDFARRLFENRLGQEDQRNAENRARKAQRFSIGSALGSIAGMGLGAFTGGIGNRLAGSVMGGGGGGRSASQGYQPQQPMYPNEPWLGYYQP